MPRSLLNACHALAEQEHDEKGGSDVPGSLPSLSRRGLCLSKTLLSLFSGRLTIGHGVTHVISRYYFPLASLTSSYFSYMCEKKQCMFLFHIYWPFGSGLPGSVLNSQGHRFHFHAHYASVA